MANEMLPGGTTARRAAKYWPWVSGLAAVVIAVGLGMLILFRENGPFFVDDRLMRELVENRSPWLDVPAYILSWLGGGWFGIVVVPLGTIATLWFLKQRWAALYYTFAASLSVIVVQVLKAVFDRPRPEEILIVADIGSFPSGHVANAATIAVSLAFIFGRTWIWFAGVVYVVAMAFSRTYLGAHWLSDTVGGALIGAGIAVIVWAPLATRLIQERKHSHATNSR